MANRLSLRRVYCLEWTVYLSLFLKARRTPLLKSKYITAELADGLLVTSFWQIEPRLTRVARLRAKKWILWCVCAWECVCVTSLRFVSEHPTFQLREPTVLLVKTVALSVALIDCLAFIGDCTWSGQKSTGLKERNRMEKWPWQNRTRVDGSVFTLYVGALPTRPSAQTTTCI